MLKRHENILEQRIDRVVGKGYALVEWWELNQWYTAERISKGIWRDLRDRFREGANEKDELYVYELPEGVLLIHSDSLSPISKKAGADT